MMMIGFTGRHFEHDRLAILDASEDHADLLHAALNTALPTEGFSRFICN
jgi:hypothetical protein